MLLGALQNLSLHDKCALKLGVRSSSFDQSNTRNSESEEDYDDISSVLSEADIASVISETEGQLETIVSAMNEEEHSTLQEEVVKIQKNIKRWLIQKNFKNTRTAARKLASRRLTTLKRREFVQKKKAATALQAAARGLRDRREFKQIRRRASASLVINRHVRDWLRRKKHRMQSDLETVIEDSH